MSIIKIAYSDINYLTYDAKNALAAIENSDNGYVYLDGGNLYYSPEDVEMAEDYLDFLDFWQVVDDKVRNDYKATKRRRLHDIRVLIGTIELDVIRLSKIPLDEFVFNVQGKFTPWDFKLTNKLFDALNKRDMVSFD